MDGAKEKADDALRSSAFGLGCKRGTCTAHYLGSGLESVGLVHAREMVIFPPVTTA
jgi:hypothetical protein